MSAATVSNHQKKTYLMSAATILFVIIISFFALAGLNPPDPAPGSAPPAEFSAERAMKHLAAISRVTHPVGSPGHAEVRSYLLQELSAIGASPELQETAVVNDRPRGPYLAGNVGNIIARLKGTGGGRAVLLAGHYDSAPGSPGAGDDGAAVAAMLETLRALKASTPLKNDVIFLFTDGEEAGLLGARAFIDEHPLAKDVGVALNFEARGSRGPVVLFETSPGNRWLIQEFARAVPHPVANSFAYEVYRLLPNETDFSVFKSARLHGLNFAFIDGFNHYHSRLDSLENVSRESLQHQGTYALTLARHFGNLDLRDRSGGNAVYFDILGLRLVHYPVSWVWPLTTLVILVFAGVAALGLKKKRLTLAGAGKGFLLFLASMILTWAAVTSIWWMLRVLHGERTWLSQSETYNSRLYLLGFVALALAFTSALDIYLGKRVSVQDRAAGGLLWWLLLLVASSLFLPGGSYLFTWPLLFSLVALGVTFMSKEPGADGVTHSAIFFLGSIPTIVLFVPLFFFVFVALTLNWIGVLAVIAVLSLSLLVPHLNLIGAPNRLLLPAASLALCLIFMTAVIFTSGHDKKNPKANTVFYGLNADAGKAAWGSSDEEPDEWTSQFFAAGIERDPFREFFPMNTVKFLKGQAPALPLAAPQAQLLEESTTDGTRTLRLRLSSPRGAPILSVSADPATEILRFKLADKVLDHTRRPRQARAGAAWRLVYYALPQDGIELTLEAKSTQPVTLKLVDRSYELPDLSGLSLKPRPDYMIPTLYQYSDSTQVSKSFTF